MKALVFAVVGLFALANASLACEKFKVEGMTCQDCVKKIEAAFQKTGEVMHTAVDLKAGTVDLHCKDGKHLDHAQIKKIVEEAGFKVHEEAKQADGKT